ncbi:uncharacterized protein LAESUDRAFT_658275 [Laetiporus sulphureus 93-53]|uniref:DEAD/DEAH-box helicase domain-containing protein n=1 Tax=Laetiporus sulphureus 93-53 TaxID=1314785 RepID=A0A165D5R8_9APHY|nr:uncharacterized protein LAESUDRAFT_658275 [Laetiporus sulphureus 93-53]KZT04200.1 hypothetical protein LAESUDRAFT_658275 [Laetiporus sulphureus 93-53]
MHSTANSLSSGSSPCSKAFLKAACEQAAKTRRYSSEATRAEIVQQFRRVFDDLELYDWQVDVTEALLLGMDCTVIGGTGAGKTMPFVMPLLLDQTKKKMVLIISPLNELEYDQEARFVKLGITATAVNGDVYDKRLHKVCGFCALLHRYS